MILITLREIFEVKGFMRDFTKVILIYSYFWKCGQIEYKNLIYCSFRSIHFFQTI